MMLDLKGVGRSGLLDEGGLPSSLPCWLTVDLDVISANVAALRRWIGPRTQIAAVVKAQAYGAGAHQVARTALAAGATSLAVARVHEAAELRAAGLRAPILVLTRTDPSEADLAVRLDLSITVDSLDLGRALALAAGGHGKPARVQLKIDTGLHRLGVAAGEALGLVRALSSLPGLDFEAIYTHFANGDEADGGYTLEQLDCFNRLTDELAQAGYVFPSRHAANSAAALAHPASHLDVIRVGLSLYGVSPSGETPAGLVLRPAVSLQARVLRAFPLAAGESVGYGQTWRAAGPTRVAIVGAGYADGVSRLLSNRGKVLILGKEAPIIGRVSMDLTAIDVSHVPGVEVGTVVTFFGKDGPKEIGLREFAAAAETIPHEALTLVGGRMARVYLAGGGVYGAARLSASQRLSTDGP